LNYLWLPEAAEAAEDSAEAEAELVAIAQTLHSQLFLEPSTQQLSAVLVAEALET
jgi:hypothetical protein